MSTEKRRRGRVSKVNMLPEQVKQQLDEMLRDGRLTQVEILETINAQVPESSRLSAAGVNRYASKMESAGARIREAREVSQQWIAKLGTAPQGEVSSVLIEMVRTLAFDSVLSASNSDQPVEPKFIKELAVGVEKLERAATLNQKRELEIREQERAEAADRVEAAAVQRGLNPDDVSYWRGLVLGVDQ